MQNIYQNIEGYNSIIIFGVSDIGKLIEDEIKDHCKEMNKTICFADNSYKKWNGVNILSPADASDKYPDSIWIIASDIHGQTMLNNLINLGISEKNIVKNIPADILHKEQNAKKLRRVAPQRILRLLEVDIAHHCNLNCVGCSAFSPLVKEPLWADLEVFESDMSRLSLLLHGHLYTLHIMGGEPLLNPRINDFIECGRKYFSNSKICIISNGILLPKMPDDFWSTCRKNQIVISITKYPIELDYKRLSVIAESHQVSFEFFGTAVDKTTWNLAFDRFGKQDPYESFCNCKMANYCVRLRNGKLATCSPILNIEFLNETFGIDIKSCNDDYIDIHKAKNGDEILKFLSKPVPFCRFCDVKNRTYDNLWGITNKEIEEWVINVN